MLSTIRRTRGVIDLAFGLVDETTHLVEKTHAETVARWSRRLSFLRPIAGAAGAVAEVQTGIAGGVCKTIRLINGTARWSVGALAKRVEVGLERAVEAGDEDGPVARRATTAHRPRAYLDPLQAAINGIASGYLRRTSSPLELGMTLQHQGRQLALERQPLTDAYPLATSEVCVFVHGLASTEHSWSLLSDRYYGQAGVTFGSRLRDDLRLTPIFVRYDSGRRIADNGEALATLLADLIRVYPVPIAQITLVGHSMGGLVVRSAAYAAQKRGEDWLAGLRRVVCLAAPHHGAPVAKALRLLGPALQPIQTAGTQVLAALLASLSEGIEDLGYLHPGGVEGQESLPRQTAAERDLPAVEGVDYHFLAATVAGRTDSVLGSTLGSLLGDLLVTVPSACGRSPDPARRVPFAGGAVFPGTNHFEILNHPAVYDELRALLADG